MVKLRQAYGLTTPIQNSYPLPIIADRAPTTDDKNFTLGQMWIYKATNQIWGLTSVVANSATWSLLAPGDSDVDALTGDTGGLISPTAGNINILGGDGLTVAGAGSTLTVNRDVDGYPITPYVVGPVGSAGYQTIQAAIDAANSDGGGCVFIQTGTYTENLILRNGVALAGVEGNVDTLLVNIVGTHTPDPANGTTTFRHLNFFGTTSIMFSAAAGEGYQAHETCNWIISAAGYIFDIDNWVGPTGLTTGDAALAITNCGDLSTGASGFVKNSVGGATIIFLNSYVGSFVGGGGSTPMLISGKLQMSLCDSFVPITLSGSADSFIEQCGFHDGGVTAGGSTTGRIYNTNFQGLTDPAFTMSSSGNWEIGTVSIDTSNNPAIAGAGAGILTLTGVGFFDNAATAGTLTLAFGQTTTGRLLATGAHFLDADTGNDITLKMGDAAGATKVSFTDSADVAVFSIDSDGLATAKEINADFLFSDGTDLIITQSPIMQTSATTGGVPTGSGGDVNLMCLQDGTVMEQFIIGTQTIIAPRMAVLGLTVSLDATIAEGAEYNFGARPNAKHAYTIGTSPAFFMEATVFITDLSGCTPCLLGFRKVEANQAVIATYTDYATIGMNNAISATNVITFTELNGGGTISTDTTDAWGTGNASSAVLKVLVSGAGVVTYTIDGAAPSTSVAFSFDAAEVVMPFFHFLNGADVAGPVNWSTLKIGFQA